MFWAEFGIKIAEAGGIPVQLPYESAVADVVDRIDALVVTGGQDVDPEVWGVPHPVRASVARSSRSTAGVTTTRSRWCATPSSGTSPSWGSAVATRC